MSDLAKDQIDAIEAKRKAFARLEAATKEKAEAETEHERADARVRRLCPFLYPVTRTKSLRDDD